MAAVEVREVRTEEERRAVFELRYAVYVDEMRRAEPYADHTRRRVVDPLDATGIVLGAFAGARAVGTARINLARESDLGHYEELYGMARFGPYHPSATGIVTKFMVAPGWRRTTVAVLLARECYRYGTARGVAFSFIDCNAHLKPFFERLGFRQVFPDVEHPVYGRVHPMVMDVRPGAAAVQPALSGRGCVAASR